MTELTLTPHLTMPEGYDEFRRRARTHKGQAHFAGTGPIGKTCRECVSWGFTGHRYTDGRGPKPAPCRKFRQLTDKLGPPVPHDARACKYFEPHPEPPRVARYDFGRRPE